MIAQEWNLIVGIAVSALLALAPWMLMVHGKLAVIATRMAELSDKVEKAAQANQELWNLSAQHETRLQTHEVQFSHIAERLQEVE